MLTIVFLDGRGHQLDSFASLGGPDAAVAHEKLGGNATMRRQIRHGQHVHAGCADRLGNRDVVVARTKPTDERLMCTSMQRVEMTAKLQSRLRRGNE